MDPNANLAAQDRLLSRTRDEQDNDHLADLRVNLRWWLHRGGFAPTWDTFPTTSEAFMRWLSEETRNPRINIKGETS